MKEKTIKLAVFGEDWCDVPFAIQDSHGFDLETLNDINEQFLESDYDWSKYYESDIVIKVNHIPAQIGNYPPPNIEVPEYWDWDVIEQFKWEDDPNYQLDNESLELLRELGILDNE